MSFFQQMISIIYTNPDPLEPHLSVPRCSFSQPKEDQLLISKTAYVSCNNEAADTETSDTQSITQDSLWASDTHTHTHTHLLLPLLPQCVCVSGRMFCMHLPCPCVCMRGLTLLCVKWRTLCTWRHTSTRQEQPSAQDLSHIQLFKHTHTHTHTRRQTYIRKKKNSTSCVHKYKNTLT